MSFGGGFGSGGSGTFGQNNNNTTGGFGSTGFGSTTGSTFGATNNASSGFGGTATSNTGSSIFGGGSGGGFGTNTAGSGFGQQNKPAFGGTSNTGGGLFGNSGTTGGFGSGGGGFGATSNTTTNTGFGATSNNTTGGGLFGQNKPSGFGTSNTGGGLFGGSNTNTNTGSGFGASAPGTFGANQNQGGPSFGNVPAAEGTGGYTFTAQTEKEPNSNVTNHFQSITWGKGPYEKYSFEELRLADYAKGQKHGTATGQPGAFGQSTGFGSSFGGTNNNTNTGGFGSNTGGGGLFGSSATASASNGFGSNTTAANTGFGGTGGGLFGSKPANQGGMFGGTNTNTSSTGGLFGGGSAGGFGTNNQQQNPPSGGLFGGAANTTQNKPGGLFGQQNTSTNAGFGGGTANTTGGGLFGNSNNNQQQQQQQQSGGLFGGGNNLQQNSNPFGAQATTNTGGGFGGGFGNNNNQAKPVGGLFGGGTNTGGGLFGNNQAQQQPATGFGPNQTQQQTGGLFGNNTQTQPANSLFGNANTQQKSGGLFGNPSNSTGGGLFGGQQQQQQPQQNSSLFAQPQAQSSGFGGSLFGNQQQNNQSSNALFGNAQNAASSILGNSQQQQNVLQGPAGYTTALTDPSPYGSASIFNGLPPPPQNSPGPIATPINAGSVRSKKPAALPQYKLNPSAASRLITPQKRGYGLSYSTYGTPSSVSSVTSTPGALTSSLLGGNLSRSLGKSYSTSNLRSQLEAEPSVLGAGALTGSLRGGSSGSLKRLTIDRSLRTDLFGTQPAAALPPAAAPAHPSIEEQRPTPKLAKRVSFDTAPQPTENGAEQASDQAPTAQDEGFIRPSRSTTGRQSLPTQPEMDQIQGNELAVVQEDESNPAAPVQTRPRNMFRADMEPKPGQYWMKPSLEQLKTMNRNELRSLDGFQVGRDNTGYVTFNEPVDLTIVDLDHIPEALVIITSRNITVYPENQYKPAVGKGLNVPSTIVLENCWPRGRDRVTRVADKTGPRVTKHIERLKQVDGTEFVSYDVDSGKWTFKVPHYTSYGLDDDDEDDEEEPASGLHDSVMSGLPPTPTPKGKQVRITSVSAQEIPPSSSALSSVPSDMMSVDFDDSRLSSAPGDDTFGFRKGPRFPGAFDDIPAFDESDPEEDNMEMTETGAGVDDPASPVSIQSEDEPNDTHATHKELQVAPVAVQEEELTMAGAFPEIEEEEDLLTLGTPIKLIPDLNDDWADRLRHTISPRKNDRNFLKQSQALLDRGDTLLDIDTTPTARNIGAPAGNQMGEIKTSVDLMRSLFGKEELRRSARKEKKTGVKWPYNTRDTANALGNMSEKDIAFHQTFKSTFSPENRVLFRENGNQVAIYSVDELPKDYSPHNFWRMVSQTKVVVVDGVPAARYEPQPFDCDWGVRDTAHDQENTAWKLLHVLFDDYSDDISKAIPESELAIFRHRIRKDRLSEFWAQLCEPAATRALAAAANHEERALAYLSMNKVQEACNALMEGKNFRLATLVALIGSDATQKSGMNEQIESWNQSNAISEMSDAIRAIHSLLAGRTSIVPGYKGAIEDKAESFVISERFNMDWQRAFGLRLWYGTLPQNTLEDAIDGFAEDLASGDETKQPLPWFLESGSSAISTWKDPSPASRKDLLWSILLLVAEQRHVKPQLTLAEALSPENAVGNPLSFRLSFELHQMLAGHLSRSVDEAKADSLAASFAASLEGHGQWQPALWTLLFLSDPAQREYALRSALARMAPRLKKEEEIDEIAFDNLKIPQSWAWEAKALQARAEGNKSDEVKYLARAHKWVEAHRVLCEEVAPLAIIERKHEKLQLMIENFPHRQIADWRLGGQVFEGYLSLLSGRLGGPETRVVVANLVAALSELRPNQGEKRKMNFVQNVAVSEMTRLATEKAKELGDQKIDGEQTLELLNLPGNEETRSHGIAEIGMRHFKAIMASSA